MWFSFVSLLPKVYYVLRDKFHEYTVRRPIVVKPGRSVAHALSAHPVYCADSTPALTKSSDKVTATGISRPPSLFRRCDSIREHLTSAVGPVTRSPVCMIALAL